MIRDIFILNKLGYYQLKNKIIDQYRERPVSITFLILVAIGFYYGYLWLSYRLLYYVYHQDVFGVLLANKLVEFLLYISVGMALLSSLTTAISHFYLSKDLEFHFSLPVGFNGWMIYRFGQVFLQSSWMLLMFGASFIWIFLYLSETNLFIQLMGVLAYAMLCSLPIMAATFMCLILVKVFPARRVHQVFLVLTVVLVSSVILLFRYMEPERYLGPGGLDQFRGLVDLISTRKQPWNPAIWTADLLAAWNQKEWSASLRPGAWLLSFFSICLCGLLVTGRKLYRSSWDRALQSLSGETNLIEKQTRLSWISRHLSSRNWSQEIRELVLFLRDPAQWSQIFVLIALMGLYLFSVSKVTNNLLGASKYTLALLNTLFVAFISLSIASRFIFTSFSADGQAIWLMKTAPDGWTRFMRGKLLVFGIPCLVFAELLGLLSGVVLELSASQLWLLALNGLWDGTFMVLLALALGMLFINPTIENPLKLIVSPGGLLLMIIGVFFAAIHMVMRLSVQIPILNQALQPYGWPNFQDGRAVWLFCLVISFETGMLVFLLRRGIKHLRTGNLLS